MLMSNFRSIDDPKRYSCHSQCSQKSYEYSVVISFTPEVLIRKVYLLKRTMEEECLSWWVLKILENAE